jgi:SAM-dependent methyltransferase
MLRWVIAVVMLTAGCGRGSVPARPSKAAPPPAAVLDDEAAKARVRSFFAAVDGRDRGALSAIVGEGFFLFEEGMRMDREALSKSWPATAPASPWRTRTCESEQVYRGSATITYVGDCKEHQPARGERPEQRWQGWNTVILSHEAGAWKVAFWQWQKSGVEATRDRYNDAYRRSTGFADEPNDLLSSTVADVKPGKALVLAMGQGRNALHLASKGWDVTGVDISDEGIRKAHHAANERGLEVEMVLADIDSYDFGNDRWDLVTMIYAGGSKDWIRRSKEGLKSGGLFILEFGLKAKGNKSTDSWAGIARGELAPQFEGWEIVRDEVVVGVADWGKSKEPLVRFVARKP